ncbi:uncharacterized protein CC84DRAFT_722689 [Paraphaeosphaeria sporulosa]|uniref:Uncharacterized protein n=1 Tax=Paraphaeosphaeria sporulosa TaxID=1460663 RepID=A0A177CFE3_9PLEO|nr:uncharacterized protein CC84DRAFT_722689 [Paraphaeosphaeria sporulosa]OAG05430.1 hypothetical protein CC84DRAFT_722689 [Paraphaeosphaeria sporulosa]
MTDDICAADIAQRHAVQLISPCHCKRTATCVGSQACPVTGIHCSRMTAGGHRNPAERSIPLIANKHRIHGLHSRRRNIPNLPELSKHRSESAKASYRSCRSL